MKKFNAIRPWTHTEQRFPVQNCRLVTIFFMKTDVCHVHGREHATFAHRRNKILTHTHVSDPDGREREESSLHPREVRLYYILSSAGAAESVRPNVCIVTRATGKIVSYAIRLPGRRRARRGDGPKKRGPLDVKGDRSLARARAHHIIVHINKRTATWHYVSSAATSLRRINKYIASACRAYA